jgi:hypothetical protein
VKSTGPPFIEELLKVGLYIEEMGAHLGQDDVAKANAVVGLLGSPLRRLRNPNRAARKGVAAVGRPRSVIAAALPDS